MKKTELLSEIKKIIRTQETIGNQRMHETGKTKELSKARREAYDTALALGIKYGYSEDAVAKIWDMAVDAIDAGDGIYPDDAPRLSSSNADGSMTLAAMREASHMNKKEFAGQMGISEQLLTALEYEEHDRPDLIRDLVDYIIMQRK